MTKYLFYLVSGYLWQAVLYFSCHVEIAEIPVHILIALWVVLSVMTGIFCETFLCSPRKNKEYRAGM